jgi:hypothetical protein
VFSSHMSKFAHELKSHTETQRTAREIRIGSPSLIY